MATEDHIGADAAIDAAARAMTEVAAPADLRAGVRRRIEEPRRRARVRFGWPAVAVGTAAVAMAAVALWPSDERAAAPGPRQTSTVMTGRPAPASAAGTSRDTAVATASATRGERRETPAGRAVLRQTAAPASTPGIVDIPPLAIAALGTEDIEAVDAFAPDAIDIDPISVRPLAIGPLASNDVE
jgi:hypothetical protein